MIIKALKYTRYAGEPRQWSIIGNNDDYAYFDNTNLLVGKNSSGKSRTLDVIKEIAKLVSDKTTLLDIACKTETFDLKFEDDGMQYDYFLDFKDTKILTETLYIDGNKVLDRSTKEIAELKNKPVSFSIEDHVLAISLKNDKGDCYFPALISWGESLRNYLFNNETEKRKLDKAIGQQGSEFVNMLVQTFCKAKLKFGKEYLSEVKKCMHQLGYLEITNIDIRESKDGVGLYVEEHGRYYVAQREMSQGMFRALSLFIMLNSAQLNNLSICLLIDNVGEGMDYERSKLMIDIIIKKIHNSNIQYFMTTNDRHIMNQVPLRFWTVIDRDGSKSVYYDHVNSKENFEDFKYTGLNNFDFLTTEFYKKGFGEDAE